MTDTQKPIVLVIEDEIAIQRLLEFNLTTAGFHVELASNSEQAWQKVRQKLPQLLLLDWMLPSCSGILLAKQFRADARTHQLPIIMLTARTDEKDTIQGLEAGADDYITKPFSPRELIARIRAALRRVTPTSDSDEQIKTGVLTLSTNAHRVTAHQDQVLDLGPTEFRLLHFFMTHIGRVYSRSQLLDFVWGTEKFVEERTVDVHIRRLRSVLTEVQADHYIQTVRGKGYIFSVES